MVDVTRRFTEGWEPLACVGQELALLAVGFGALAVSIALRFAACALDVRFHRSERAW